MINRKNFFDGVRSKFFGGTLSQPQVDGMNAILNEWEHRKLTDLRWLAYMLGTTYLETAKTMQPVREAFWLSEDWRKANLRYFPYYGRGFVQLTWLPNYQKMGQFLHLDLVNFPDLAMRLDAATQVLFEGMLRAETGVGDFTNMALEDFFNADKTDWVGARKIINGTDKASEIAEIAKSIFEIVYRASL
jgi:glycosyl hydrolase family 19 (putative chitinase)